MMAFLLTEDGEELFKVPSEETTIGRGPSLQVTDTRVSRNHAIIKLEDGKVFIKPIHKNPTFIYKSSEKEILSVLKKDLWNQIFSGETICLLPKDLKFTLRIDTVKNDYDVLQNDVMDQNIDKVREQSDAKNDSSDLQNDDMGKNIDKVKEQSDAKNNSNDLKNDIIDKNIDKVKEQSDDSYKDISMDRTDNFDKSMSSPKKRILPSWMANVENSPKMKKKPAAKKVARDSRIVEKKEDLPKLDISNNKMVESAEINETVTNSSNNTSLKTKSSSTSDDVDVLNSEVVGENSLVTHSNSTSSVNAQQNVNSNETSTNTNNPSSIDNNIQNNISSTKDNTILVCPYGSRCYRKNPQHFQDYSHDSPDGNEDKSAADDKPECQYGTSCYRQNPQHKRDFKHTKAPELGSLQHQSEQRKTRPKRKKKDPSKIAKGIIDSDDDGEENNYDFNDSFIDDEMSDDDVTDDDDEDYIPDSAIADDEEDIDELVSEAKDFVKNM